MKPICLYSSFFLKDNHFQGCQAKVPSKPGELIANKFLLSPSFRYAPFRLLFVFPKIREQTLHTCALTITARTQICNTQKKIFLVFSYFEGPFFGSSERGGDEQVGEPAVAVAFAIQSLRWTRRPLVRRHRRRAPRPVIVQNRPRTAP